MTDTHPYQPSHSRGYPAPFEFLPLHGVLDTPLRPSFDSGSSGDPLDGHEPGQQGGGNLETKPKAIFLTKLYSILKRPEYQSMIRWDPAGKKIIIEQPEQLALHVLPTIYCRARFASFSRQLNLYGFTRKIHLRDIDPAMDDLGANVWSHPTLNRYSPPEVVANIKRSVPPRLLKYRNLLDTTRLSTLDNPTPHTPHPNLCWYHRSSSHAVTHSSRRRWLILSLDQMMVLSRHGTILAREKHLT